jgi:Tfp pilus assembly PilM family ATPase
MTRATGVHLSGDAIRIVCLERSQTGDRVRALAEKSLPLPFNPTTFQDPDSRDRIGEHLTSALASLDLDGGCLISSLEKEFYYIKKVPLEVASDEDRKDQIHWEASQTLLSPLDEYDIDYYPSGRSAFWIAIRKEIRDFLTGLFCAAGHKPSRLIITPVALYHACELAGLWTKERNAAILLDRSRLSFVAGDSYTITTAETTCIHQNDDKTPQDADSETLQKVKSWVSGDLSLGRNGRAFDEVYFSGEAKQTQALIAKLAIRSPELKPLEPFETCDLSELVPHQHELLSRQSIFAVAAGLAYLGLKEEDE